MCHTLSQFLVSDFGIENGRGIVTETQFMETRLAERRMVASQSVFVGGQETFMIAGGELRMALAKDTVLYLYS
jgi:hypothetical protein